MDSDSFGDQFEPWAAATIRRISAEGTRWRVRLETRDVADGCQGRFVFEPDGPQIQYNPRLGPVTLKGPSREDMVAAAHELPDERLRELLHSLA